MKETIEKEITGEEVVEEEIVEGKIVEKRAIGEETIESITIGSVAIGNAAGVIWDFLNQQSEPVNLSTLKNDLSTSSTLLMMGLGWLARENKLAIETPEDSPSYRIFLKR